MLKKYKILAVIPARGGSKGIKLKNLRKVNNKTLIEITANFTIKSKIFDFSVVSSDNSKILKEANKYGLNTIHRPKSLSGDKISDVSVLIHAVKLFEKNFRTNFDIIVMLHPTSPLRKIKDVKKCIKLLIEKKFDSIWTISKLDSKYHPLKQLNFIKNKISYYSKKGSSIKYRQQLDQLYYRNSNAYVIWKKILLKKKKLITKNTGAVIVKSKQVSIDNLEDLKVASSEMKKLNYVF